MRMKPPGKGSNGAGSVPRRDAPTRGGAARASHKRPAPFAAAAAAAPCPIGRPERPPDERRGDGEQAASIRSVRGACHAARRDLKPRVRSAEGSEPQARTSPSPAVAQATVRRSLSALAKKGGPHQRAGVRFLRTGLERAALDPPRLRPLRDPRFLGVSRGLRGIRDGTNRVAWLGPGALTIAPKAQVSLRGPADFAASGLSSTSLDSSANFAWSTCGNRSWMPPRPVTISRIFA